MPFLSSLNSVPLEIFAVIDHSMKTKFVVSFQVDGRILMVSTESGFREKDIDVSLDVVLTTLNREVFSGHCPPTCQLIQHNTIISLFHMHELQNQRQHITNIGLITIISFALSFFESNPLSSLRDDRERTAACGIGKQDSSAGTRLGSF